MEIGKINLKLVTVLVTCFTIAFFALSGCKKEEPEPSKPNLSSAKLITSFTFVEPPETGIIDEAQKTITFQLDKGTIVTALTPVITVSEKATVSPASGVPQNFTSPVVYTVTAENGSTQKYTVTVNVLDDRDEWVGFYTTKCSYVVDGEPQDYNYIFNITKSSTDIFGIKINDFMGPFYGSQGILNLSIYAKLNGNNMTITSQTVQGITFSGSGSKDQNKITFNTIAIQEGKEPVNFTQVATKMP